MSDSNPIVIHDDGSTCGSLCFSGDIKWTPGQSVQEKLQQLSPEQQEEVAAALKAMSHNFFASLGRLAELTEHGVDAFYNGAHAVSENIERTAFVTDALATLGPLASFAHVIQV